MAKKRKKGTASKPAAAAKMTAYKTKSAARKPARSKIGTTRPSGGGR